MRRKWTSFDKPTTDAEFRTVPDEDLRALFYAMDRYGKDAGVGYIVKSYGDDLFMIKAKGDRSGRCLFFTLDETDRTLLVALLAYKKESQEAPKHLIETARERRGRYLDSRRK